jgi:hypothetical protein
MPATPKICTVVAAVSLLSAPPPEQALPRVPTPGAEGFSQKGSPEP